MKFMILTICLESFSMTDLPLSGLTLLTQCSLLLDKMYQIIPTLHHDLNQLLIIAVVTKTIMLPLSQNIQQTILFVIC